MIANKQTEISILEKGNQEDIIEMSLDQDSSRVLMNMLSKNLYSDPIGSLIRETCSNALDSHRRINQTAPIIVSLGVNENNSYEFSVEDTGSGLDENDVKNIISKYGKSTKRLSNNELGMFGQ
jgi:HSP90 family molecular chaperone